MSCQPFTLQIARLFDLGPGHQMERINTADRAGQNDITASHVSRKAARVRAIRNARRIIK
jgi:hypothetical protein